MTTTEVERWAVEAPEGAPAGAIAVAPPSLEDMAEVLEWASKADRHVLPWGGGTHMGPPLEDNPDLIVLTSALDKVVDWQPDDLTLVVEAGALVADIEAMLSDRNQSAMLIENPGRATVGGTVAAGVSGYRRRRYGPTRDRMLEVKMATGDGRVVTAGARVVKNVTGYDIPRLLCGSLGSLGIVGQVCLKLWPAAPTSATVTLDDPAKLDALYRPLAVVETEEGLSAFLAGTAEEVEAQTVVADGAARPGLAWPAPLEEASQIEIRVPAPLVAAAVAKAKEGGARAFRAQHGVGIITVGFADWSNARLVELRAWAEGHGGAAVVMASPETIVDRWGAAPGSVPLQRRVKAAFDPRGVMVPGRLPGGV